MTPARWACSRASATWPATCAATAGEQPDIGPVAIDGPDAPSRCTWPRLARLGLGPRHPPSIPVSGWDTDRRTQRWRYSRLAQRRDRAQNVSPPRRSQRRSIAVGSALVLRFRGPYKPVLRGRWAGPVRPGRRLDGCVQLHRRRTSPRPALGRRPFPEPQAGFLDARVILPPQPRPSAVVDPRIGDLGPALLALDDGSI